MARIHLPDVTRAGLEAPLREAPAFPWGRRVKRVAAGPLFPAPGCRDLYRLSAGEDGESRRSLAAGARDE